MLILSNKNLFFYLFGSFPPIPLRDGWSPTRAKLARIVELFGQRSRRRPLHLPLQPARREVLEVVLVMG